MSEMTVFLVIIDVILLLIWVSFFLFSVWGIYKCVDDLVVFLASIFLMVLSTFFIYLCYILIFMEIS